MLDGCLPACACAKLNLAKHLPRLSRKLKSFFRWVDRNPNFNFNFKVAFPPFFLGDFQRHELAKVV